MRRTLEKYLGANSKMRSLAIAFILSALLYNFPWLLNWLPGKTKEDVLTAADYTLRYGVGLGLLWAKQSNVSGNGTESSPFRKPNSENLNRIV